MKILRAWACLAFFLLNCGAVLAQNAAQTSAGSQIVITEIAASEPSETEWIEIYNKGMADVDLSGWKFFENNTNHGLLLWRGDAVIKNGEFAVIANKPEEFLKKYPAFIGAVFDSSWSSLKENGEQIGLKDAQGNFSELFAYPGPKYSPREDKSLQRANVNISAKIASNWFVGDENSLGTFIPKNPAGASPAAPPDSPEAQPSAAAYEEKETSPALPKQNNPPLPQPTDQTPQKSNQPQQNESPIQPAVQQPVQPQNPSISTNSAPPQSSQKTQTQKKSKSVKNSQTAKDKIEINDLNKLAELLSNLREIQQIEFEIIGTIYLDGMNKKIIQVEASSAKRKEEMAEEPAPAEIEEENTNTILQSDEKIQQNGDESDSVRITELLPNPNNGEDEWIELRNTGDSPVNLGRWMIADTAKKSRPWRIPDSITIQPNGFALIKKEDSKISLNNNGDEVFLFDFKGNEKDSVSFGNTPKGQSYALIQVKREPATNVSALAASALTPERSIGAVWQWIADPTPAQSNPALEEISGLIGQNIDIENGLFQITAPDGAVKNISFSSDVLNPKVASLVLKENSTARIAAQESSRNFYALRKIEEIAPPQTAADGTDNKKSRLYFIAAAVFLFFLSAFAFRKRIKNFILRAFGP